MTSAARFRGPLLAALVVAVAVSEVSRASARQAGSQGAPKQDPAGAPPRSLSMGGKKSVMTFFITSRGSGRGGDLGGLRGADAHCQALAAAEGAGDHAWRA